MKDTLDDIILPDGYGNLTIVDVTNSTAIATGYNVYTHVFGDLWVARYWILGMGFGASLIIGFMYTFLLRIPGVNEVRRLAGRDIRNQRSWPFFSSAVFYICRLLVC